MYVKNTGNYFYETKPSICDQWNGTFTISHSDMPNRVYLWKKITNISRLTEPIWISFQFCLALLTTGLELEVMGHTIFNNSNCGSK